jgi:hypothetical protein
MKVNDLVMVTRFRPPREDRLGLKVFTLYQHHVDALFGGVLTENNRLAALSHLQAELLMAGYRMEVHDIGHGKSVTLLLDDKSILNKS